MIHITETAATELLGLLSAYQAEPDQGVKLFPEEAGNLGMTIAAPAEGDEVVHGNEGVLLIVDGRIAQALDGAELDVQSIEVDGQQRPQFTLRPPERPN